MIMSFGSWVCELRYRAVLGGMLSVLALAGPGWAEEGEARYFRVWAASNAAITGFTTDGRLAWSNEVLAGTVTVQVASESLTNWRDHARFTPDATFQTNRVRDPRTPSDMVFIPDGIFEMGDALGDGAPDELPIHTVYTDAFYMDKQEVTVARWNAVATWAEDHGYDIYPYSVYGKAANHPVVYVSWNLAVKWCNARSQMEGLAPCYTVGGVLFTNGESSAVNCDWSVGGYRLPTEAEWEKAARGGSEHLRFPWDQTNTIDHLLANYDSVDYPYDANPYPGYHVEFEVANEPYSNPVDYFPATGYGLYDMAGNVREWCWDFYHDSYYLVSPSINPTGPAAGTDRVMRGGAWNTPTFYPRVAARDLWMPEDTYAMESTGFRCVRKP
mgnify:CR=1 FL=1